MENPVQQTETPYVAEPAAGLHGVLTYSPSMIIMYVLTAGHICFLQSGSRFACFSSSFSYGAIRDKSDEWHCCLHFVLWMAGSYSHSGGAACLYQCKYVFAGAKQHELSKNNDDDVVLWVFPMHVVGIVHGFSSFKL